MEIENFEKVLNDDYSVDIGASISEGFDIFKKEPGAFIGFLVINFIISLVLSIIPFIGGLISAIITTYMYIGLYKSIRRIKNNQEFSFNNFFDGFKMDIGQVLGLTFIPVILIVIGFFCFILPGIYLAVAYMFAIPIFSVVEKDFFGAMEMSRKIITKKWFSVFLFLIVLALFNILGAVCLLIGLLVTIPVSYCAVYVAFEKICQVNSIDGFNERFENFGKPDLDV